MSASRPPRPPRRPSPSRRPRRCVAARLGRGAGAALVTAGLLAGCGVLGGGRQQGRDLVVIFAPGVTAAQVARVRSECDGVGGAKARPPGPPNAVNRDYPLRFDITGLSERAQTQLTACLARDPVVRGVLPSDARSG